MYSMQNTTSIEKFVDRHANVKKDFAKRASAKEFSPLFYIIYLNFATVVLQDGPTLDGLLRYGADEIY